MLNRLVIVLVLTLGSTAIPMQDEANNNARSIQSLDIKSCIKNSDYNLVTEDIINNQNQSSNIELNCNN